MEQVSWDFTQECLLIRLPPKLAYVFGCDHYLQKRIGSFTLDPQIEGYRKELKRLAQTYGFEIYCEEIDHPANGYAH